MESGSEYGTYIAYAFVVLFLVVVAVAAARSYGMILSLVALAFMPKKKADYEAAYEFDDTKQSSNIGNGPPS